MRDYHTVYYSPFAPIGPEHDQSVVEERISSPGVLKHLSVLVTQNNLAHNTHARVEVLINGRAGRLEVCVPPGATGRFETLDDTDVVKAGDYVVCAVRVPASKLFLVRRVTVAWLPSDIAEAAQGPQVFVIHGHDEGKRRELEELLRNEYKLPYVVLQDEPGQSRTFIEKFEDYAKQCHAAIALLTPDDITTTPNGEIAQPRPNVMYELGWFAGKLGRDRTLLIVKEGTYVPSDWAGIEQLRFHDNISELIAKLRKEIDMWRG